MTTLFSSPDQDPENMLLLSPVNTYVKLNDVLQKILLKYQIEIQKRNLIIRCETLPVIEGDEKQLYKLMENVFSILLDENEWNVRHFLHIDCQEDNDDVIDLSIKNGHKRFQLQFNSNRNFDVAWKDAHQETIDECHSILSQLGGRLKIDSARSNCCSFSIILPGKLS